MPTAAPFSGDGPPGLDEENDENREDVSLFCGLALGEDDLVHEEEDHHRDAAVEHGGTDVVDEVGHQQTGHRHPDAVDGVDDAGDETEGQQVPADLFCQIALAAEDEAALDGKLMHSPMIMATM